MSNSYVVYYPSGHIFGVMGELKILQGETLIVGIDLSEPFGVGTAVVNAGSFLALDPRCVVTLGETVVYSPKGMSWMNWPDAGLENTDPLS